MKRDNKIQLITWAIFIPLAFLITWAGFPIFRYLNTKFISVGCSIITGLMGGLTFLIVMIIVSKCIKR